MVLQMPKDKQRDFILNSNYRINAAHGAIRSGKSVGSTIKMIHEVITAPPGNILFVGKTLNSLKRNILNDIAMWVGPENFKLRMIQKEAEIYGRTVWLEGANDDASYQKIQGETLVRALGEEITTWPESFFKMMMSRLSEDDARAYLTMNPGPPNHWFKKQYLDREADLNMKSWHFTLEDNPYLSEQYIIDIKKEYTGLWYERYIDGKWVLADGTIYSNFDKSIHCIDKIPDGKWQSLYIGCDYGQTHPTAFLKAVKIGDTYYITDEYKEQDKLNTTLSSDLKAFIGGKYPRSILVDPSAKSFKNQLIADDFKRVKNANNTVNDGLAKIANAFETGKLVIVQNRCPQLIEEIGGYVWDSKASERGDEKPIKENDDLLDCLRYIGNEIF